MPVDTPHPEYVQRREDWELMRDTFDGQRKVKSEGTKYLPATGGQEEDGMQDGQEGKRDYEAYKTRAYCPDFVQEAITSMVGLMHREPAIIEVPERMMPMLDRLTPQGESAWAVLRRINENQLLYSRLGLMLDIANGKAVGQALPHVLFYDAFSILNWDQGSTSDNVNGPLDLVVLDESGYVRKADFSWKHESRYRILKISSELEQEAGISPGVYVTSTEDKPGKNYDPSKAQAPSIAGKELDFIPFVLCGSNDLVPEPDDLPLLGLGELVVNIYRQDADYKQALHFQAQDTLVIKGGKLPEGARIGAGGKLEVSDKGDAKFIGTRADGLGAMRTSLMDDRSRAGEMTTRLFDGNGDESSGRALNVRLSAKTANLNQIALTGAEALERILRMAAEWLGLNPDEVKVEPNMDFEEDLIEGTALLQIMQAKRLGLPWSNESIHRWLAARDYTEMSFEDELSALEKESEDLGGIGIDIGDDIDPNSNQPATDSPEDDEDEED